MKTKELGIDFTRASTAGNHPFFIDMVIDLIEERLDPSKEKLALVTLGPRQEVCAPDCCLL